MMAFEAMEPERLAFLSELYTRSAGDARQGVPYQALVDALGFGERVTKRIQRAIEREGLVELTAVPRMTTVGRTVMDHAHQQHYQQTISMTPQGMRLMEDLFATRANTAPPPKSASSDQNAMVSRGTPRNSAGIIGGVPRHPLPAAWSSSGQSDASQPHRARRLTPFSLDVEPRYPCGVKPT